MFPYRRALHWYRTPGGIGKESLKFVSTVLSLQYYCNNVSDACKRSQQYMKNMDSLKTLLITAHLRQ